MTSDIRTVIREILLEELDSYVDRSGNEIRKEKVSISSDGELKDFALRVLEMADSGDLKTDLQSGKTQFILEREATVRNADTGNTAGSEKPAGSVRADSVQFQKGLVTEKDIARLDDGISRIDAGKNVFFTPLAKDEIRRRGLIIERISQ